MKKFLSLCLFACCLPSLLSAQQRNDISVTNPGITFAVDGDLPKVEDDNCSRFLSSGEEQAQKLLKWNLKMHEKAIIHAGSFMEEKNLYGSALDDIFFGSVFHAYACHHSLTLSPDMIWLLISQGFARYVNAHPETMRSRLVSHKGKIDLVVQSKTDLKKADADWSSLMSDFTGQIKGNTKGDIAQIITADFSTTGETERIASQITLMETVKKYFEFDALYVVCGIPYVTLLGTPEDWRMLLAKIKNLKSYGCSAWLSKLESVLKQFVSASEGNPDVHFWRNMVKKKPISSLKGGCSPKQKPTMLDGWILLFFPDENGKVYNSISYFEHMFPDRVRVGFQYHEINPVDGAVQETPMELWGGFVGARIDTLANMVTPVIGWMVCEPRLEEALLSELQKDNQKEGIAMRVKEVPQVLSKIPHIKSLELVFTDAVVLPEWMDDMIIDTLKIYGKIKPKEKEALKKRFPHAVFEEDAFFIPYIDLAD